MLLKLEGELFIIIMIIMQLHIRCQEILLQLSRSVVRVFAEDLCHHSSLHNIIIRSLINFPCDHENLLSEHDLHVQQIPNLRGSHPNARKFTSSYVAS